MSDANNEKLAKRNKRKNRTAKSRKNQNALRKVNLQVLGNIGNGYHESSRLKKKIRKEYLRRKRKCLETNLCSRNLIKGIKIWVIHFVRYHEPFLKWTRVELKEIDQRTRKSVTLLKALHLTDDICVKKRKKK